jgi:hypothetical protein
LTFGSAAPMAQRTAPQRDSFYLSIGLRIAIREAKYRLPLSVADHASEAASPSIFEPYQPQSLKPITQNLQLLNTQDGVAFCRIASHPTGDYSSRFSIRLPQCVSLRSDLNTSSLPWLIARSIPTRAWSNGPRPSAAMITASTAACLMPKCLDHGRKELRGDARMSCGRQM